MFLATDVCRGALADASHRPRRVGDYPIGTKPGDPMLGNPRGRTWPSWRSSVCSTDCADAFTRTAAGRRAAGLKPTTRAPRTDAFARREARGATAGAPVTGLALVALFLLASKVGARMSWILGLRHAFVPGRSAIKERFDWSTIFGSRSWKTDLRASVKLYHHM